ncbi:MAG: hypothetical protein ACRDHU_00050 [Actinomycetota bacterium]
MEERFPDEAEIADEERRSEHADPAGDAGVPEADALEQATDVQPPPEELNRVGERPEADALDQARGVEEDDEFDDRR